VKDNEAVTGNDARHLGNDKGAVVSMYPMAKTAAAQAVGGEAFVFYVHQGGQILWAHVADRYCRHFLAAIVC
jgi:hypothetical protein